MTASTTASAVTFTAVSDPAALLRLLQLASPTLPVGAYAYSQGLEQAVDAGWIADEVAFLNWLQGMLTHSQSYLDVPVFARLYRAWERADEAAVARWNAWLFASRESGELQQEDRHLGGALARLLVELDVPAAARWRGVDPQPVCFATVFSLAARHWSIALRPALGAYLWAWCENQVAAAIKLVPLGQTAGQRVLSAAIPVITAALERGLALDDDDIGYSAPALAIASARHEHQYSRLFRS